MAANESLSITVDTHSVKDVDMSKLGELVDGLRAQYPGVDIRVNPTAQELLMESTRRYAPEIAEAIDAGDFDTAFESYLARYGAKE